MTTNKIIAELSRRQGLCERLSENEDLSQFTRNMNDGAASAYLQVITMLREPMPTIETSPSDTVVTISFLNMTSDTRNVWVVANPEDLDGLLAQLIDMRHVTDIQTHDAVVKREAT